MEKGDGRSSGEQIAASCYGSKLKKINRNIGSSAMLCQECVGIKPSEQTGEIQCQLSLDMKDQPASPKAHPKEQ